MRKLTFILFVITVFLSCSKSNDKIIVEEEIITTSLLPLPRGIISTGSKGNPINQEIIDNPLVDGFMILQSWKDIETSEGVFNWSHLDSEVNRATSANKKVRIAIHAGGTSVPDWVMQNYPSIQEIFVYDAQTLQQRYHPAYWDLTFIDVKSNFYAAISERYNANENVFAISASIADPNTGDWSFRVQDDIQKQTYLDAGFTETAFIGAYKRLIDNVMNSFQNKYVITAVGPIPTQLVDDKYFALNEVLDYAFSTYDNQLIIAKGSLHANTPEPLVDTNLNSWQMIWDYKPHCAAQLVWSITNDPQFKMNGGTPYAENEKEAIFMSAFDKGISYELNWIEPWSVDILNPDLQDELEYARNRLIE